MKILLIEDDETVSSLLKDVLSEQNYVVDTAEDGQIGLDLALASSYDLILLDIMMPRLDGISLCRQLRARGQQIPILLLTAKDTSSDLVMGLDAGADDYVVKPFNLSELMARIRALMRRGTTPLPTVLVWEHLLYDPSTCEVTYAGKPLHLTPKESNLLELFLRNPKRVFSRSAILERLWSLSELPGEDTVTTHIKGLRHKLKTVGAVDFIETVYGLGYRLKDPLKSAQSKQAAKPPLGVPARDRFWERYRVNFEDRIADLKAVCRAGDRLSQQAREKARALSSSLRAIGWTEGARLVKKIEVLLDSPYADRESSAREQDVQELIVRLEALFLRQYDIPTPQLHVLVIDDDELLTEAIRVEATAVKLFVQVVANPSLARQSLAEHPPDAILLDLSFPNTNESGLTFLSELAECYPEIPVAVFTGRDGLQERVDVARLGGRAFLQKPVPVGQVLETLQHLLEHTLATEARVLIVDDSPAVLSELASLLQPWGVQVTTLDDPNRFWEILNSSAPHLLIIDTDMPEFSGFDLCQVVRSDPRWEHLPVLVLTERADIDWVYRIFAVGADDYVRKPIVAPETIARTIGRLERSGVMRYARKS